MCVISHVDAKFTVMLHGVGVLTVGEDYELNCTIIGREESVSYTYQWRKVGEKNNFENETMSTLSLSPLAQTSTGSYTCIVTGGESANNTVSITVQSKSRGILKYRILKYKMLLSSFGQCNGG